MNQAPSIGAVLGERHPVVLDAVEEKVVEDELAPGENSDNSVLVRSTLQPALAKEIKSKTFLVLHVQFALFSYRLTVIFGQTLEGGGGFSAICGFLVLPKTDVPAPGARTTTVKCQRIRIFVTFSGFLWLFVAF